MKTLTVETLTAETLKELAKYAEDIIFDYYYVGIRFETKEREIGEVCDNSKHNADREDERDFPEYGTAEYDELDELDGTSAWRINSIRPNRSYFSDLHCYVIGSNDLGYHPDPDYGEMLMKDAVVLKKIF